MDFISVFAVRSLARGGGNMDEYYLINMLLSVTFTMVIRVVTRWVIQG
ncbi:MAG: hypothetical protein C5S49_06430 [Candidatus Methanogaster sp.]|nr:MAG: hypothetical protein C5S49_06430 [ANME-2 cluster archaeon]